MSKIKIPNGAAEIIDILTQNNHEAYVVGGCVRDSLLLINPKDWDICTSATPQEVKRCFDGYRVIETGIKHGTVTVVMGDCQYEITTFRTDGAYSDNRRPDSVEFVKDIREDLARRDFTINAMAYSPKVGLIDPFGGSEDLQNGVLSCVGDANDRFNEDALRIMRALRFSSCYGFEIAKETAIAVHKNTKLLRNIAAERINSELRMLLCGSGVLNVLLEFNDVITTIIPELKPCIGFDQNNKYHCHTVYDHTAHAVANYTGKDIVVKIALLLHDIGKPFCYTEDHNGGHFFGHPLKSKDIAEIVLNRLKFDNTTKSDVLELVLYHDNDIEPSLKSVRRWMNRIAYKQLMRLIDVKIADSLAHTKGTQELRILKWEKVRDIANQIIEQDQCFSLKDLAINGDDLISFGIPEGKEIGNILNELLMRVIDGDLSNEKDILFEYLRGGKQ